MSKLAKYLNQHIVGNVFDSATIRDAYATDRSIMEVTPRLVALPDTVDDVKKLVFFSNQLALRGFELPITVRGTGLDKTGAALGSGLIISTAHLNHIEEVDVRGRLVRAQPGVTLGALNTALRLLGLELPIDADPRLTLGGLISNCLNDDTSDRYGGIFHFVERAEIVQSNGDLAQLMFYSARQVEQKIASNSFEGNIYRRLEELCDQAGDTITDRSTRPFDAAGYANITRVREGRGTNLLPLIFAAQGTLGIITDIILRVEALAPAPQRLAAVLHDTKAMLRFANFMRDLDPASIKLYDLRIIRAAAAAGKQPALLSHRELGDGWLVLVNFRDARRRAHKKILHAINLLPVGAVMIEESPENTSEFQEFESAMLSFLNDDLDGERAPVIDDVYLPSYKLPEFLDGLALIEQTMELSLPIFGSFATSNYHVRPDFDLTSPSGRRQAVSFLTQYSKLVASCDGSLTGGTPEGRIKALPTAPAFSDAERELYQAIKDIFDPNHILNPGVKLGADLKATLRSIREQPHPGIMLP